MAEYSFSPQFANLANLQPLPAIDVTRGGALQFQPLQAIQVQSSQPELVSQAIAGAATNIAQGALGGITAKWEKEEAAAEEDRKFAQQEKIARIKAAQSSFEKSEQRGWEWDKMQEQNRLIKERAKGVLPPSVQFEDEDLPENPGNQPDGTELTADLLPEGVKLDDIPAEIPNQTSISPEQANQIYFNVQKQIDPATGLPLSALPEYGVVSTGAGPISPSIEKPSLGLSGVDVSFISPEQEKQIEETTSELSKADKIQTEVEKPISQEKVKPVKYFRSEQAANEEYQKTYPGWKKAQLPELVETAQGPAFVVKREILSQEEQEEINRKKREDDLKISQAESAPEMSKEQNAILLSQMTRLDQDKTYSKALESRDSLDTIFNALAQSNGLSDIAAINAFQRMVDPGVAVREGDVALIQSALSFMDRYSPEYISSKFTRGAKLPEEDREKMRVLAKELTRMSLEKANNGPIEKYRRLAKKTGIDPDLLVSPFDIEDKNDINSEKEQLIRKISNPSEEYKNSPQFQQDRERLKQILKQSK